MLKALAFSSLGALQSVKLFFVEQDVCSRKAQKWTLMAWDIRIRLLHHYKAKSNLIKGGQVTYEMTEEVFPSTAFMMLYLSCKPGFTVLTNSHLGSLRWKQKTKLILVGLTKTECEFQDCSFFLVFLFRYLTNPRRQGKTTMLIWYKYFIIYHPENDQL